MHNYDEQGRLSQVLNPTALYADFAYNALGQRTIKRAYLGTVLDFTVTQLYGQDGQLLGLVRYNNLGKISWAQYWIWLDGMPLAQLELRYNTNGAVTSTNLYYLHSDHLNTPRLATNQAQTLLWKWDSDAFGFGNPIGDVDGDGVVVDIPLRFPGQIFEAYSNLNYNYFRDYEANTGRYVQSDPIGLRGGLNTYGYVRGNPLFFVDPTGLDVYVQCRPAQIAGGIIDHCWVKTDTKEAGMGSNPDIPPGQQWEGYGMPVQIIDHSKDTATTSTKMNNVNEECVNNELVIGKPLGRFMPPLNQCQSFAYGIVNKCRTGPQIPDVKIDPIFKAE